MTEPRVLVFTCSYNRPHMLRQCILNIQNQTYKNITHSINITLDKDAKTKNVDFLYDDLVGPNTIVKYSLNTHQHYNHSTAITNIPDYKSYDIFVKVDDDDIYKKRYIESIVATFVANPSTDITSSKLVCHLNGHNLNKGDYDNLGGNPPGSDYHMPPSFAFNRRTLDLTLSIDPSLLLQRISHDSIWRKLWSAHNLIHTTVPNERNLIMYVHGKNISTGYLYKP
jgi:glycosyltransferase involved in cell wall biosynthesis